MLPVFCRCGLSVAASKLPPIAKDGVDTRSGLPAQANAAKCGNASGISYFFFNRIEQVVHGCICMARVPEYHSIIEKMDCRHSGVVRIILMHQQINRGLTESEVLWMSVFAMKGFWDRRKTVFRPFFNRRVTGVRCRLRRPKPESRLGLAGFQRLFWNGFSSGHSAAGKA